MLRGLLLWLLIMAIETVHGILRAIFLVPRVGEELAGQIGWPVGLVIVFTITLLLIRRTKLRTVRALLALGAVWAVLTFFFEVAIGLLRGFDVARILAEINPLSGGLMVYTLAVMAIAPLAASWFRSGQRSR